MDVRWNRYQSLGALICTVVVPAEDGVEDAGQAVQRWKVAQVLGLVNEAGNRGLVGKCSATDGEVRRVVLAVRAEPVTELAQLILAYEAAGSLPG